ncbi:NUDIX hydrolase [Gaoshiqia sp. Z1-71]|uniref:NUDIX hydrolase n=1 Tax=Gaoshiqia hydrogeniformans TaxID=3290090 RepID=UPI003BF853C2
MYKVFFNEYLLLLRSEINNSFKDNIYQNIDIEDFGDFFRLISDLDRQKYAKKLILNCLINEKLLDELPGKMSYIRAAGGLVKDGKGNILFIKRLGRWDLPKGKVEKKESLRQAAIREVKEECGLDQVQILRQLQNTCHIYQSPYIKGANRLVWKETSWFEMLHTGNGNTSPQEEEDIDEVRWFAMDELDEVFASTYGSLKELLRSYLT